MPQRLADELVAACDGRLTAKEQWKKVRRVLMEESARRGEWAGFPLLHDEFPLILEKRYPYQELNGKILSTISKPKKEITESAKIINRWRTDKDCWVIIAEDADGTRWRTFEGNGIGARQDLLLKTLGVAANEVWSVEAEEKAMTKLKELVTEQQYKLYVLCGMFPETSNRSKVQYVFRKLRPTLAYSPNGRNGNLHLLTALCLHPLGYYSETFGGAHVPTDDVIAHLMMMRADEAKFWGKANHHSPHWASAGI